MIFFVPKLSELGFGQAFQELEDFRALCMDKHGNMLNAWHHGHGPKTWLSGCHGACTRDFQYTSMSIECIYLIFLFADLDDLRGFNLENKPGVPETVFISRCQDRWQVAVETRVNQSRLERPGPLRKFIPRTPSSAVHLEHEVQGCQRMSQVDPLRKSR